MLSLEALNDRQQEAVLCTEGPLLILAGAGSGKTRVLTNRTAYLIEELGVNPWNILAITFTNKAAKEMRERIDDMVGVGAQEIWVSTFHSTCLQILFRHAEKLGYDNNFEICDATDQRSVMKEVCKRLEVDSKMFKERMLLNEISRAKDSLISPSEYAAMASGDYRKERIAGVYEEYQKTLKKNNAFDFDDLIMKTVELFLAYPDILEYYQNRFRYIMVDEYQDTNTAQFELIHLLANKYRNLCVVGDDDQSIYKFRGANIYNILDFEKTYPEATVIKLEQNYRSTRNILEAANGVIRNNVGRKEKSLWCDAKEGSKIHFRQLDTAAGEAMYIAEDIKKKVGAGKAHYGDCAILLRTNVQSKEFEDAFRLLQIDYDLVKGLKFWDTKVIKDLTSYLITVASGKNDMRTSRIINLPKRGIGAASIGKLQDYADMRGISLFEACEFADDVPGLGKAAEKIKGFDYCIQRLRAVMREGTFGELLDAIIDETEYMDYLGNEAETPEKYTEMQEYIAKLRETLTVYEEENEQPDLMEFMRQNGVEGSSLDKSMNGAQTGIDILTAEQEKELRQKRVLIMTMHNAKGLEFPHVYMAGMEDGLFPSYMTITGDDPEEMEEERRLCYVAITRAREELTLTCARQRMVNGETRYSTASRFIKEIPFGLLDMKVPSVKRRPEDEPHPASYQKARENFRTKPYQPEASGVFDRNTESRFPQGSRSSAGIRPTAVRKQYSAQNPYAGVLKKGAQMGTQGELSYGTGDRVEHIKFGEGTVKEIKSGGRDYEVTVEFDNVGVKKMFASFAKLKKV